MGGAPSLSPAHAHRHTIFCIALLPRQEKMSTETTPLTLEEFSRWLQERQQRALEGMHETTANEFIKHCLERERLVVTHRALEQFRSNAGSGARG